MIDFRTRRNIRKASKLLGVADGLRVKADKLEFSANQILDPIVDGAREDWEFSEIAELITFLPCSIQRSELHYFRKFLEESVVPYE